VEKLGAGKTLKKKRLRKSRTPTKGASIMGVPKKSRKLEERKESARKESLPDFSLVRLQKRRHFSGTYMEATETGPWSFVEAEGT